jgi:prolipoprotein diacylglyceryl transferase
MNSSNLPECGILAWLFWDPPREAFTIPYFDLVVVWYGIIFASGFVAGYYILIPILRKMFATSPCIYPRDITDWHLLATQIKNSAIESSLPFYSGLSKQARNDLDILAEGQEPSSELKQELLNALNFVVKDQSLNINRKALENKFPGAIEKTNTLASLFADRITWFIVLGTIIGARLGHVLFYDWDYYSSNPLEILMIRKGGLASHGGTLGIMLALVLFLRWNRSRFPEMTFIKLIDILVIPTSIAVCFIRIANFFNQEILGNPTDKPWGVIFGHAADGTAPIPRHPVQLYEAFAYLFTFIVLYTLWKVKGSCLKTGTLSGLFFILVFGSRFFLEFLKEPQSPIDSLGLQMGQYLSIPFILFGVALLFFPKRSCSKKCSSCCKEN